MLSLTSLRARVKQARAQKPDTTKSVRCHSVFSKRAQELSQDDGRRRGERGSDAAPLLLKWKSVLGLLGVNPLSTLCTVTTSTSRNEVGYGGYTA